MENFINSVGIEKIILFVLIFNVTPLLPAKYAPDAISFVETIFIAVAVDGEL